MKEMARPKPSSFTYPPWRESLHTGWPRNEKMLGLPEALAAKERRHQKHQKQLKEMEFQIFHSRERIDILREHQRMSAARKLSVRLKDHEVCAASASAPLASTAVAFLTRSHACHLSHRSSRPKPRDSARWRARERLPESTCAQTRSCRAPGATGPTRTPICQTIITRRCLSGGRSLRCRSRRCLRRPGQRARRSRKRCPSLRRRAPLRQHRKRARRSSEECSAFTILHTC